MDGVLRLGAASADNAGNMITASVRSVSSSFSKSHGCICEVGDVFGESRPTSSCSPHPVGYVPARFRSFPAFSLASLSQLLVGYPINRKAHHFVRIGKTELLLDVRSMRLDGFDAEIDLFRDGTCAVSAAQHYQDLEFPIG